ncbi:alpha-N-acetylglucosaminidase [Kitasatospora sp. NPDC001664]
MKPRFRRRLSGVLISLAAVSAGLTSAPAARAAAFDTSPAAASLQRLLPAQASQFVLRPVDRTAPGVDSFSVSGGPGAIQVSGTSPATLLTGVGWYLRNVAHVDIGLPGTSTSALPATLPAVAAPYTNSSVVPHRYALNDVDNGYTGAYRSFADYQREIDVLALHGINEVLVTAGAEQPYYRTLQQFGYGEAELRSWVPGPAHQPWWLMQNMSGSASTAVSAQLIAARAAVGRQICDRLRALGMTPVLPGYFGTVPADFAARNPGAHVVAPGSWVGFTRPSWLDPNDRRFPEVAAAYYANQAAAFGSSSMFKMDPLQEGGSAGDIDVTAAAGAIQRAMLAAHPDATWAILGWQDNPSDAVLAGVDKSRMLIVDGLSDRYQNLDREASWHGTPYAFGTIANMGGKTTFGANSAVWTARFQQWLTRPGSAVKGIAYMPEGTGTDPAAFALFADLAWSAGPIDQPAWFRGYATARYGAADADAAAAWEKLRSGPYSMPSGSWAEPQDSLFTARPSLTASTSASWSPGSLRYDPATVQDSLTSLLRVAPALRTSDAYRFDLLHTARQALDNRGRALLPQIAAAHTAKDLTAFRALTAEWNRDLAALDELMATDSRFLVGSWLAQVDGWGASAAETDRLRYDARSLVTTWGNRSQADGNGLRDYAAREYSGLVKDLYAKRWAAYFQSLETALATGTAPAAVDFFAMDDAWARGTTAYPTTPTGDVFTVASAIAAALPPVTPAGPVTGSSGKCVDVTGGNSADGTALQLYTCNGTAAQTWAVPGDGTLRAKGKCMDVRNGAVTPGTVVQLYGCNGTPAQSWTYRAADRTLRNLKSGLCLDASGGGTADGTALIVWTCTANANQRWTVSS